MHLRTWSATAATIGVGLATLSACGTGGGTNPLPSGTPTAQSNAPQRAALATRDTPLGRVLTDAEGRTLYRFDKDTPTTSACTAECASLWPPALGEPAGTLPGALATVRRADGATQATYDGHPVYRYVKDTAPGQTTGDGVKGVWHVVLVAPAGSPSPTASGS